MGLTKEGETRLFFGGLSQDVKVEEIKEKLSSFGSVETVEFCYSDEGIKLHIHALMIEYKVIEETFVM
jgi:hypothetical protein